MKLNKRLWVLMFVACLSSVPALYAADSPQEGTEHSAFFKEKMEQREKQTQEIYDQLNLTNEQKQALEANKTQHREKTKALYEQKKSAREALNQELMKVDLDMGKINAIHQQLKDLGGKIDDERLNSILEVRNILTAEKFAKFFSLMEQKRSKSFSEGSDKR